MRKRQISNMHGGYRGCGATLDWHTTYQPSMIKVDNKPLQPIPPSLIEQPTIEPPPTTPPQIINKPTSKPVSNNSILAIVGLSAASIATATYLGHRYVSGIINERDDDLLRRGLLKGDGDDDEEDINLNEDEQISPKLIDVLGNGPREGFFDVDL
jgi:hypothetical protein